MYYPQIWAHVHRNYYGEWVYSIYRKTHMGTHCSGQMEKYERWDIAIKYAYQDVIRQRRIAGVLK